jgi:hypothetical protein
MENDQNG